MAQLGHYSLVLAFGLALFCTGILFWGASSRSGSLISLGRRAVIVLTAFATLASIALLYAFITDDFSIKYVEATSRTDQFLMYKISAFWSAQEGSLLFWFWLATIITTAVAYFSGKDGERLVPYALAVLSVVNAFFAMIVAFVANPFAQQFPAPIEGRGLTPLLQDPGMFFHPVLLYIGFVGMGVPFAFGLATLLEREKSADWLRVTRRWTLIAWLFLTLGIVVGGWWAYRELGWGGYWAWDPVENSSFIPWLFATAFFHSAMVEERRGLLKNWNVLLISFGFITTIFSTFLTRSGILSSVHAFASSPIAPWFMGFLGILIAGVLYLVLDRYEIVAGEGSIDAVLSKESSFLLNNLILLAVSLTVLLGTVFPLLAKLAGQEVSIGAPYYNTITGPLFGLMLVLMGICPLVAWRRAKGSQLVHVFRWPALGAVLVAVLLVAAGMRSPGAIFGFAAAAFAFFSILRELILASRARARLTGENAFMGLGRLMNRNPRRYGGYLVHLGIVIMAAGIIGSQFFQQMKTVPGLRVGESFTIKDFTLDYNGLREREVGGGVVGVYADIAVRQGDRVVGTAKPEWRFFPGDVSTDRRSSEASIDGGFTGDLYVLLGGWEADGAIASFEVYWNPMVGWIWVGLYILIAGTLFAIWPRRRAAAVSTAKEKEVRALAALGELELDYGMGKVALEDYQRLKEQYAQEATEAIQPGRPSASRGTGANAAGPRKKRGAGLPR